MAYGWERNTRQKVKNKFKILCHPGITRDACRSPTISVCHHMPVRKSHVYFLKKISEPADNTITKQIHTTAWAYQDLVQYENIVKDCTVRGGRRLVHVGVDVPPCYSIQVTPQDISNTCCSAAIMKVHLHGQQKKIEENLRHRYGQCQDTIHSTPPCHHTQIANTEGALYHLAFVRCNAGGVDYYPPLASFVRLVLHHPARYPCTCMHARGRKDGIDF